MIERYRDLNPTYDSLDEEDSVDDRMDDEFNIGEDEDDEDAREDGAPPPPPQRPRRSLPRNVQREVATEVPQRPLQRARAPPRIVNGRDINKPRQCDTALVKLVEEAEKTYNADAPYFDEPSKSTERFLHNDAHPHVPRRPLPCLRRHVGGGAPLCARRDRVVPVDS